MNKPWFLSALLVFTAAAQAQTDAPILGNAPVDQAIRHSLLFYGDTPYHTVLEIAHEGDVDHTGRLEIWWAGRESYRIEVASPHFRQDRVVSFQQVQETDTGTFFPRWLQSFEDVFLAPVPEHLRERGSDVTKLATDSVNFHAETCFRHDDRPGGIIDQMTWASLCLDKSERRVASIVTFNDFLLLDDWHRFGNQEIAYRYSTSIQEGQPVVGMITTLEPLSPQDQASIAITAGTPPKDRIGTTLVSTAKAESLLETAPAIRWPPVHEGKTDGFMTIYARTDRAGQVREAYPQRSDNPALRAFGAQQALNYKFKPLLVDGVPVQMEMPLVLHFASTVEDQVPVFTVSEMKRQIIDCHPDPVPPGVLANGQSAVVRVSVDEAGNVATTKPASTAPWNKLLGPWMSVKTCKFRPYLVQGKPTPYKGDIELPQH